MLWINEISPFQEWFLSKQSSLDSKKGGCGTGGLQFESHMDPLTRLCRIAHKLHVTINYHEKFLLPIGMGRNLSAWGQVKKWGLNLSWWLYVGMSQST